MKWLNKKKKGPQGNNGRAACRAHLMVYDHESVEPGKVNSPVGQE